MDGYKNIFGKKLRDSLMHMYEYEWLIGMLKTRVKWDEYFRVLLEIAVPVYMRQLEQEITYTHLRDKQSEPMIIKASMNA